jgi:hypothetical protein
MTTHVPNEEELVKILSAPDAPPMLTLDLTNSDGPLEGILHAYLNRKGKLVLDEVD